MKPNEEKQIVANFSMQEEGSAWLTMNIFPSSDNKIEFYKGSKVGLIPANYWTSPMRVINKEQLHLRYDYSIQDNNHETYRKTKK